jgi:NAD(P)-dependent dehydrogenase (short-subunit alcohol dehydrogenase family)
MAQIEALAGKVAIVTGAGGGIGRAEARQMAAQGAKLVANDISAENAEETVRQIRAAGGEALVNVEPVGEMGTAQNLVKLAVEKFGRLDILVNNAGNQAVNPIDEMTEEQWDSVQRVHLKGAFSLIKYSIPVMKRQRSGVVINTSSEAGLGRPIAPAYCAAKEGLVGLTRAVAREQGRFGIRCNAIRPRAADTGLTRIFAANMDRWIPLVRALGRYWLGERGNVMGDARPETVAVLVAWLCSDKAAHVNGRTFFASGEEMGFYSEPELVRLARRPGGWDADSFQTVASNYLTLDLTNNFLLKDTLGDREL